MQYIEPVQVIKYTEYTDYDRRRQEANTAINAMLAGCKLASHFLALTRGATRPLAEIFPSIPQVRQFNLRTDVATRVLNDAEHHLGLMAVPFIQAIHEDYAMGCLDLLQKSGRLSREDREGANNANLHQKFEDATGDSLEAASREVYQLLRLMRNSVVHRGGQASQGLEDACTDISAGAAELWRKVTRNDPPHYSKGDQVQLGSLEIVASLAVTKRLARLMNLALGGALPRAIWLERLIEDFTNLRDVPPQREKRIAKAFSLAQFNYAPLGLSRHEVEVALARASLVDPLV